MVNLQTSCYIPLGKLEMMAVLANIFIGYIIKNFKRWETAYH